MGQSIYIRITNNTFEIPSISYPTAYRKSMYAGGESSTDFGPISGPILPINSLPVSGTTVNYPGGPFICHSIEARSTDGGIKENSDLVMMFTLNGQAVKLVFTDSGGGFVPRGIQGTYPFTDTLPLGGLAVSYWLDTWKARPFASDVVLLVSISDPMSQC